MKKRSGAILIAFFLLYIITYFQNASIREFFPDREKEHPTYKGVTFIIPGSVIEKYEEEKDKQTYQMNVTLINLDKILDNLIKRFDEAVSAYNSGKGKLPSCLREALDRFLADLKSGAKKLDIGYSNGGIDWNFLRGDEKGSGRCLSGREIWIYVAFKERYRYSGRKVLTAALLFHELIHAVKKAYPNCFQELGKEMEEATTEDGEVQIFGKVNSITGYDDGDYGMAGNDCTYKNVCICKDGCPKEREDTCALPPPPLPTERDFFVEKFQNLYYNKVLLVFGSARPGCASMRKKMKVKKLGIRSIYVTAKKESIRKGEISCEN